MPDSLDDLIRAAAEDLEPDAAVSAQARARVLALADRRRGPLARLIGSRRGRAGTLALALILVGGGAAASVSVLNDRSDGFPYRPAAQNCFALNGYTFRPPRLTDAVHLDERGRATVVWTSGDGVLVGATRDPSGGWGAPAPLSGPSPVQSGDPALTGNSRGDLALAWVRADQVQVALRPADGSWGPVRTLSRPGQRFVGFGGPSVVVGPSGEVIVTWSSIGARHITRVGGGGVAISGSPHFEVAAGTVAGGVGRARILPLDRNVLDPQSSVVAIDGRGVPVLASSVGVNGVSVTDLDPTSGLPLAGTTVRLTLPALPRALGGGSSFSGPSIAVGPGGDTAVAWSSGGILTVATRPAAGAWQRPVRISSPGAETYSFRVAVGHDGRAVVAWVAVAKAPRPGRPGHRSKIAWASLRAPGGAWEKPVRLSGPDQIVSAPEVGLDGQGRASAFWALGTNGISGKASTVQSADRGPGDGTWSPTGALSSAGLGPLFPRVATNGAGDAVAVWSRCTTRTQATVEVATRGAGSSDWSQVTRLAAP